MNKDEPGINDDLPNQILQNGTDTVTQWRRRRRPLFFGFNGDGIEEASARQLRKHRSRAISRSEKNAEQFGD